LNEQEKTEAAMPPFLFLAKKAVLFYRFSGLFRAPMRYLTVDGMLSGTGIRNTISGGYVDPHDVGLSTSLVGRIEKWLVEYEAAHHHQFMDKAENERLDQVGAAITRQILEELPRMKVEYFSNAEMRKIAIV
jgi:hypothetical protein